MGAPRLWQACTAVALLTALPAFGQALDSEALQRSAAVGNALVEKWIHCTQAAATKLAMANESAEVVATAVFGVCSPAQNDLFQHMLRIKMSVGMADDYMAKYRARVREQVIAQVMTLRAAK